MGWQLRARSPRWKAKDRFLQLAESYAWLNPHLTLRVSWNGEQVIDIKASNPAWRKWLPTWPTSAHWYDKSSFRRYMAAHIANRDSITVREFISEFRGMTGTAKQKLVLAETGASHVSLHNYFGLHKANTANIAKLLASMQKHTKPVQPAELGIIGKEHLYRRMEAAGGDPKTFTYNRTIGETNGVPRVIEFAFGIHRDGLAAAGAYRTGRSSPASTGLPESTIRFGNSDAAAPGWTGFWRKSAPTPHNQSSLPCTWLVPGSPTPTAASRRSWSTATRRTTMAKKSDRPRDMANDIIGAIRAGTTKWTKTRKTEERSPASRRYRYSRMTRERGISLKEAAAANHAGRPTTR